MLGYEVGPGRDAGYKIKTYRGRAETYSDNLGRNQPAQSLRKDTTHVGCSNTILLILSIYFYLAHNYLTKGTGSGNHTDLHIDLWVLCIYGDPHKLMFRGHSS